LIGRCGERRMGSGIGKEESDVASALGDDDVAAPDDGDDGDDAAQVSLLDPPPNGLLVPAHCDSRFRNSRRWSLVLVLIPEGRNGCDGDEVEGDDEDDGGAMEGDDEDDDEEDGFRKEEEDGLSMDDDEEDDDEGWFPKE